jgi:GxxExxY protein
MKYSTKRELDSLSYEIIGAAMDVHRSFGPGLLESFYHDCMKIALRSRKLPFETEMTIPVEFMGEIVVTSLRCDLFIDNAIVVELKSVQEVAPVHKHN